MVSFLLYDSVIISVVIALSNAIYRRLYFLEASMKKMFSVIITQLCGDHGGKIINGATSAASR